MTVGQRIRKRRLELEISVESLSKIIEKNRATVYRYENDSVEPSIAQLLKIAKALNTSVTYLLGDTDNPEDSSWWVAAIDMAYGEISDDNSWKEAAKVAEEKHLDVLYSICMGDANSKSITELYNKEFLATRINMVTDFILRNKEFLQKNMPGITIINNSEKDKNDVEE